MRIVLDSNVVLSAILWSGVTRRLIDAAIEQRITLLTSTAQLAELERVAPRKRFERIPIVPPAEAIKRIPTG